MHKPPTPRSLQCFEYWRVKRHGAQSAKVFFLYQSNGVLAAVSMNSFLTIKTFSFRRKGAISVSKPMCTEHIGRKVHGRRKRTQGRCRGYLLFPAKLTACHFMITVLLSSCSHPGLKRLHEPCYPRTSIPTYKARRYKTRAKTDTIDMAHK